MAARYDETYVLLFVKFFCAMVISVTSYEGFLGFVWSYAVADTS